MCGYGKERSVAEKKERTNGRWMSKQKHGTQQINRCCRFCCFAYVKYLDICQFKEKYMELMFLCVSASMCAYNE